MLFLIAILMKYFSIEILSRTKCRLIMRTSESRDQPSQGAPGWRFAMNQSVLAIRQRGRQVLSKVSTSNKAVRPFGDQDSPSVSQNVPQEILLEILEPLAHLAHLAALAHFRLLSKATYEEMEIPQIHTSLTNIVNASRVCKSWSLACTHVLYTTPYITSQRRLRLFCKTLQSNPSLGRHVKELFLYQLAAEKKPWTEALSTSLTDKDAVRKEFIVALRQCPGLEKMRFTTYYQGRKSPFIPWDEELVRSSELGTHLQELWIYSDALPGSPTTPLDILPTDLSLSSLKCLHLSSVSLSSNHELPTFPQLHTLTIDACTIPFDPNDGGLPTLKISSEKFPALTTFVSGMACAPIIVDEVCMGNLRSLQLFGRHEYDLFMKWVNTPAMDNLRGVTVALDRLQPGKFMVTRLPQHLKVLCLYLAFELDRTRNPRVVKPYPLLDLQPTFVSAIARCTKFRTLRLDCGNCTGLDTTELDAIITKLRKLCEARAIELTVTYWSDENLGVSSPQSVLYD